MMNVSMYVCYEKKRFLLLLSIIFFGCLFDLSYLSIHMTGTIHVGIVTTNSNSLVIVLYSVITIAMYKGLGRCAAFVLV